MMSTSPPPSAHRSPWIFFGLVFLLLIPFLVIGFLSEQGLLNNLGVNLPLSAFAFVCPVTAAIILVYREEKLAGVGRFLKNVLDVTRIRNKIWYLPIVLLLPAIYLLSYGIMLLMDTPLPAPQSSLPTLLILLVLFVIAAFAEEAGWMGYAFDPLESRWNALGAALMLGIVWSAVHILPDIQGHKDWAWIAGQRAFSIALRVLIVWLYNNTGKSVVAAILFHAMDNLSVFTLFPNDGGGHYIPAITAAITIIVAAIVTFLWGPRTLARFRYARHP